jgi:hypothetical protein
LFDARNGMELVWNGRSERLNRKIAVMVKRVWLMGWINIDYRVKGYG